MELLGIISIALNAIEIVLLVSVIEICVKKIGKSRKQNMTARKEDQEMVKALIRAIIRILELNGVDETVIDQIRALIR